MESRPVQAASEQGQGMVEYGLMVGLIAALVLAVFVVLSPTFRDLLTSTASNERMGEASAAVSSAVYD